MTTGQLRRALHRWKQLWDIKEKSFDFQVREKLGFTQYAPEFWWLAMLLMEVEITRSAYIVASLPINEEAEDTSQIHATVKKFEDLSF
jgi:hypothetical protein